MKALSIAVIRFLSVLAQPQSQPGAAGYWEGAITLPRAVLGVQVGLERDGAQWKGTISIPVQGLRNFSLTNITVRDADVAFAMPGSISS